MKMHPILIVILILFYIIDLAGCGSCSQKAEKTAGQNKTETEQTEYKIWAWWRIRKEQG